jgi:hypothetical protein
MTARLLTILALALPLAARAADDARPAAQAARGSTRARMVSGRAVIC